MKTKNYFLFALFLIVGNLISFAQCGVKASDNAAIVCGGEVKLDALSEWSKTLDNAADIVGFRSVHFINADTGYTVGENGLMHRTWDGGKTWAILNISGGNSLRSVFFTDLDTGFVVGKDANEASIILRTTDGGNNWTTQTLTKYGLTSVYFTSKNVGFAVGAAVAILKTTDAGRTWIHKRAFATDHFISVNFPTADIGYAIGEAGTICKTIDGGENWDTKLMGNNPFSAYFTDANTGFLGFRGVIQKTTDGGNSWIPYTVGDITDTIKTVFFVNSMIGYAGGRQAIWKTKDGGITWQKQTTQANINSIFFPNGKVGYATGTQTLKLTEPESINWSPSTGLSSASIANPVASPNQTTKYKVMFTTTSGCTATDSVTVYVNPLAADAGTDKVIICGGDAQLDVTTNYPGKGTLSYSWSPSHDLSSTTIANPISSVAHTSTYKVIVTSSEGCIAADSLIVLVSPLTANAGNDQALSCKSTAQFDAIVTNYTGTAPLTYSWSPITGLDNAVTQRPVTTLPGTYTVTVSTINGCTVQDVVVVNRKEMDAIDICMVSVDTAKNLVIWNKPVSNAIDSFYIYRETNVTGNYAKIGSVAYSEKSIFKDLTSQPEVKSNKYTISVFDACGLESAQSAAHKTMHLTINKGTGITWNLIWESYVGFPVATYKIYRGTTPANLVYFDATSGSNNQYTDNNPPLGDVYYQLEVVNPNPCDNSFNSTRSNVARNNQVGINEIGNTLAFSIYPNPTTELLTVNVEKKSNEAAYLIIYNTLGAAVKKVLLEQSKQQINVSDLENGFYMIEAKSANYSGQQKLVIQK